MQDSNIADNLNELFALKASNPNATHVYVRRDDDELVDIPIFHAEISLRNHPRWRVEGVATAAAKATHLPLQAEKVSLPPKPSERKLETEVYLAVVFTDKPFEKQAAALKKDFPKMHKALSELAAAVDALQNGN